MQHLVLVSPWIKLICRELVHFSPRTRPPLKFRFDHCIRIVFAEHTTKALLVTGIHSEGAVDQIVAHSLQRGQPKAGVVALGVIVVSLLYCVEVSVLARVGANTGCVLPVAPVAAGVVVDEQRFEVFGAVPPVLKGDNENSRGVFWVAKKKMVDKFLYWMMPEFLVFLLSKHGVIETFFLFRYMFCYLDNLIDLDNSWFLIDLDNFWFR